jgi:hypothetical protein
VYAGSKSTMTFLRNHGFIFIRNSLVLEDVFFEP